MRLFLQSENANGMEMLFGITLGTNGILGLLAGLQRNYSLCIFTFVMAFFNFLFSTVPIYVSMKPIIQILRDQTSFGNTVHNPELNIVLFVAAAVSVSDQT